MFFCSFAAGSASGTTTVAAAALSSLTAPVGYPFSTSLLGLIKTALASAPAAAAAAALVAALWAAESTIFAAVMTEGVGLGDVCGGVPGSAIRPTEVKGVAADSCAVPAAAALAGVPPALLGLAAGAAPTTAVGVDTVHLRLAALTTVPPRSLAHYMLTYPADAHVRATRPVLHSAAFACVYTPPPWAPQPEPGARPVTLSAAVMAPPELVGAGPAAGAAAMAPGNNGYGTQLTWREQSYLQAWQARLACAEYAMYAGHASATGDAAPAATLLERAQPLLLALAGAGVTLPASLVGPQLALPSLMVPATAPAAAAAAASALFRPWPTVVPWQQVMRDVVLVAHAPAAAAACYHVTSANPLAGAREGSEGSATAAGAATPAPGRSAAFAPRTPWTRGGRAADGGGGGGGGDVTGQPPVAPAACHGFVAQASALALTDTERARIFSDATGTRWQQVLWAATGLIDATTVALQVASVTVVAPPAATLARCGGVLPPVGTLRPVLGALPRPVAAPPSILPPPLPLHVRALRAVQARARALATAVVVAPLAAARLSAHAWYEGAVVTPLAVLRAISGVAAGPSDLAAQAYAWVDEGPTPATASGDAGARLARVGLWDVAGVSLPDAAGAGAVMALLADAIAPHAAASAALLGGGGAGQARGVPHTPQASGLFATPGGAAPGRTATTALTATGGRGRGLASTIGTPAPPAVSQATLERLQAGFLTAARQGRGPWDAEEEEAQTPAAEAEQSATAHADGGAGEAAGSPGLRTRRFGPGGRGRDGQRRGLPPGDVAAAAAQPAVAPPAVLPPALPGARAGRSLQAAAAAIARMLGDRGIAAPSHVTALVLRDYRAVGAAADMLTGLVAAGMREDRSGLAHAAVPVVISSLAACLASLVLYMASPRYVMPAPALHLALAARERVAARDAARVGSAHAGRLGASTAAAALTGVASAAGVGAGQPRMAVHSGMTPAAAAALTAGGAAGDAAVAVAVVGAGGGDVTVPLVARPTVAALMATLIRCLRTLRAALPVEYVAEVEAHVGSPIVAAVFRLAA
jgi:hypothetical protein